MGMRTMAVIIVLMDWTAFFTRVSLLHLPVLDKRVNENYKLKFYTDWYSQCLYPGQQVHPVSSAVKTLTIYK